MILFVMLNQLRQTLRKLLAPRRVRRESLRMRWPLERLEDRVMLSASFGPKAYGHGGAGFGPHGGVGPYFAEPAAFASHPQQSIGYEPRSFSQARNAGPAFKGIPDRSQSLSESREYPLMQDTIGPPQEMSTYDTASFGSTWERYFTSPPQFVRTVPAGPLPLAAPEYHPAPTTVSSPQPVYNSKIIVESIVVIFVPSKPPSALRSPFPNSIELPTDPIPSPWEVPALAGSLTDVPATQQLIARDNSIVAMLTATARDLAFRDYAPNLLLLSTAASNDRVNLGSSAKDAAPIESLDGFIRPYSESFVDDLVHSTDSVTQEREAINRVLRDLRDVETPLPANAPTASAVEESDNSQDLNVEIDLWQTESIADEMPAGEVQGGMVLLQSTGDANESGFDLTPVYAERIERFNMPASMETSVGLIQAIDVAADEIPVSDSARPANSTAEPQSQIQTDDRLQTQREEPTSRKSAALVGATTLTGGLLWLSRKASKDGQPQPVLQKRRVRRS